VTRQVIGAAIGIVTGTVALTQVVALPWENRFLPATEHSHGPLLWILNAGYPEEITKGLPVLVAALVLLKWRKVKLDVRMWMFLGTIAG
jgi:RsiW-degrading membrane proteinase PrsW (M82 family)